MTVKQLLDKEMDDALHRLDSARRMAELACKEIRILQEKIMHYDELRRLVDESNRTER